jgi:transposase
MTIPKDKGSRTNATPVPASLPVIRPLVAGVDVGSTEHWVCGPARDGGHPNVRVFGTTTDQLHELAEWLAAQGVESVALESTHVYWIPIYELLESRGIEVVLVNARQLHNVPGRKTDFHDCQWLQLLHSCGLLRGSFRPGEAITRLRALQRQLANLVAERTRCVQWMQKALDQMNVQVHRAVADLTGLTGMAIVRAIVAGERDPARLAMHRDRRCRKSAEELARYLTGNWRPEHLFNLASALRLFDALDTEIAAYEAQLLQEIASLQPPDRQEEPAPHPNPAKEKAIKARGSSRPAPRSGDLPGST